MANDLSKSELAELQLCFALLVKSHESMSSIIDRIWHLVGFRDK